MFFDRTSSIITDDIFRRTFNVDKYKSTTNPSTNTNHLWINYEFVSIKRYFNFIIQSFLRCILSVILFFLNKYPILNYIFSWYRFELWNINSNCRSSRKRRCRRVSFDISSLIITRYFSRRKISSFNKSHYDFQWCRLLYCIY